MRQAGAAAAGPRITGQLDLEGSDLEREVFLQDCSFDEPVSLHRTRAPAVCLPGCHLPSIEAVQLETRGNLMLDDGLTAGCVDLRGARRRCPDPGRRDPHQPARHDAGCGRFDRRPGDELRCRVYLSREDRALRRSDLAGTEPYWRYAQELRVERAAAFLRVAVQA